jgi:alkylation response protein AidB-like acyl-CoA dehydrogenase
MLVDVDGCSLATYNAAWRLQEGPHAAREFAMAEALLNEKSRRTAAQAVQIHGSIGFTDEHDLPFYFNRAKASQLNLGHTRLTRTG